MNPNLPPIVKFLQKTVVDVVNAQREQKSGLDYIQIDLPTEMEALPDGRNVIQERLLGRTSLSLAQLAQNFDQIARDPRPSGVILVMRGLALSGADMQTLRQMILHLRESGKRVIAYAQSYDLRMYYVASACDEILLQPGGDVQTQGLYAQQLYLKDGLNRLGIEFNVLQVSPYKSAADRFNRTEPSEEVVAMTNWLLDSHYETLITDIASARNQTPEAVRTMIDEAPYTDLQALEGGYVDALCSQEGFYSHLKTRNIMMWDKARNQLLLTTPKMGEKFIGVLKLSGMIINGESAKPPVDVPLPLLGNERIGDITAVNQIRSLHQMPNLAALVVYVDSPGGSATASEAIASALEEIAKRIPVVVYMNTVAASGGYYISTPADWIVAQPLTITGSIGVIFAKATNYDAYDKLNLHPYNYQRGKNADLMSASAAWSDEQRTKLNDQLQRIYQQFMGRVADCRKMKVEQVDAIGGGRVWTGAQAYEHGLVDQLGSLRDAIDKARELAKLDETAPAIVVARKAKPLPAQIADGASPAATLRYWHQSLGYITNGQAQMLIPFHLDIK